jgi:hypothetical protein
MGCAPELLYALLLFAPRANELPSVLIRDPLEAEGPPPPPPVLRDTPPSRFVTFPGTKRPGLLSA